MSQPNPSRFSFKTGIRAVVLINIILAGAALWFGNWGMAVLQGLCAFALFGLTVLFDALAAAEAAHANANAVKFGPGTRGLGSAAPPASEVPASIRQALFSGSKEIPLEIESNPPLIEWVHRHSVQPDAVNIQEARDLVADGADPAAVDAEGDDAYVAAALLDASPEVLDVLIELGVDAHADPALLERMLEFEPKVSTLAAVIARGADVNAPPTSHNSLLEQALEENQPDEVVMCLIDAGADITMLTSNGDTLLAQAIEEQYALSTQLALVPFWEGSPALGASLSAPATEEEDWGLDDALVHVCKDAVATDALVGPLVLAGANPFASAPTYDETAVAVLVENCEPNAIMALAQVLPMTDRYRLQGYIEALDDTFDNSGMFQSWIHALTELEQAWLKGYGDPEKATPRRSGELGTNTTFQLSLATEWPQVQRIMLSGADPLASIKGKPSALERVLLSGEYHLAAMMLECLSDEQARAAVSVSALDPEQQRVALGWLAVRRASRKRYIAASLARSANPGAR